MSNAQDPNFPSNLSIKPLEIGSGRSDYQKQAEDIDRYGIAGRVWEGGSALLKYFTPDIAYDPPCSLLIGSSSNAPYRIVELGSGQSVPSLHLASILSPHDVLILTDLPDVVPLCEERVLEWEKSHANGPLMKVEALAWGGDVSRVRTSGPLSHILLCDLIYFPQLYPPLLRTLLELTEPSSPPEDDVFGPEIILSYFSRTLALEQAFFDALALYFQMTPVTGGDWEARIYICRRWRITTEWKLPELHEVMNGMEGVIRGTSRSYGLIDQLFGELEWDAD